MSGRVAQKGELLRCKHEAWFQRFLPLLLLPIDPTISGNPLLARSNSRKLQSDGVLEE